MKGTWTAQERVSRMRAPRRGSRPTVSIVVASHEDRSRLATQLAPLAGRCKAGGVELIVAWAGYPAQLAALKRGNPGVRFVAAPHDATLEQLRSMGLAEAAGDVVALTDDDGMSDEARVSMLIALASEGDPTDDPRAAGGDWSTFLERSGLFLPTGSDDLRLERADARVVGSIDGLVAPKGYGILAFCVDLWRRSRARTGGAAVGSIARPS